MPPRSLQRIIDTFLLIEAAFSVPLRRDIYKTYTEFERSYRRACRNRRRVVDFSCFYGAEIRCEIPLLSVERDVVKTYAWSEGAGCLRRHFFCGRSPCPCHEFIDAAVGPSRCNLVHDVGDVG